MPQPFTTGPCLIYTSTLNTSSGLAYEYLGTSERGATVILGEAWEPVVSDPSGPQVPFDVQYMGQVCYIEIEAMIRWNNPVLQRIDARRLGDTPGTIAANSIGSLMVLEGFTYSLCLVSPYASKAAYTGLEPAWVFPCTWLFGPSRRVLSTRALRPSLIFQAIPQFNFSTGSGVLYTNILPSGLQAPT
jgi:hypothetical protein